MWIFDWHLTLTFWLVMLLLSCVAAVDKSLSSSLTDAREALINAVVDMLTAYRTVQGISQSTSQLPCPYQLRHAALYVLAMLKSVSLLLCFSRTSAQAAGVNWINISIASSLFVHSYSKDWSVFFSLLDLLLNHTFCSPPLCDSWWLSWLHTAQWQG